MQKNDEPTCIIQAHTVVPFVVYIIKMIEFYLYL